MTKKWLMYAVTGLLCCSLIGFAVAKQNATNSRTALERAKLELATPNVNATSPAGSLNMNEAQINAAMAEINRAENTLVSAKAPEGYSVPTQAVSPYEAAKAAYERMLNNTMLPGDKALIETLPAEVAARPVQDNLDDNGGTWFSWSGALVIPDAACPARTTQDIVVAGLANPVADVEVRLNVTHTWDGDCQYYLIGPNAVEIALILNRGGSGDNFVNCVLDDEAATAISAGAAPFTGSFRPEVPLSTFDGINGNGTWTLSVCDWAGGDVATVTGFELQILEASAGPDLAVSMLTPCGNNQPNPTQTVSLRVTNGGGSAAAATTARFDFDGGATIGTFAVPALAPSSFFDVFFTTTVNLTVGPHTLVGSVDAVAGETITGNNTTQCVPNGFNCYDFAVTAPGTWTGTTIGAGDDCALRVGLDNVYQVTIPTDGAWTFTLCGGSTWDTYLYLTDACCGGTILALNDDSECSGVFTAQSTIACFQLTAGTYYVDIEPWSGASGPYSLEIRSCVVGACCYSSGFCGVMEEVDCVALAGIYQGDNTTCEGVVCENPCTLDCDPFDLPEGDESNYCLDNGATDPNGGPNVVPPAFQDIACGDAVCADAFTCDATGFRDTDWFRFTTTENQNVTVTAVSEFNNLLFGIIDVNGNAFIVNAFVTDCALGAQSVTAVCLPAGTYAMIGLYGNFSGLPQNGGNNQYRMTLTCAPCDQAIGQCCYNNFNDCQDVTAASCATLGGFWDEFSTCAENPCVNPCVLTCGNNDVLEVIETGYCNDLNTDPNGGCNVTPPSFTEILCGDTVCAEAFTCDNGAGRDTDWFRFTVVQPALVTVSATSEFNNLLFGIVGGIEPCAPAFIVNGFVTDCSAGWVSVSSALQPGVYVAFGAFGSFSGLPENGANNSYRMAVTGLCVAEPCDPVVDLAIYTQTVGNAPDAIQLFWTAPQPEDYKVWSTTNPNNDGNPNDGADIDWTLEATLLGLAAGPQSWTAPSGFVGYKNYNVTSVCNVVQAPTGRCCYPDFVTCADITEAACAEVSGTWTAFESCALNPCPPPPPANDDCGNAVEVLNGVPLAGYNTGAVLGADVTACTFSDVYDVWYVFNAANTNLITASLCEATFYFDTGLSAWDACGGTELACNDDFCLTNGLQSEISWTPAAAGPVYIRVAGYNNQTGNFTLTVTQ